MRDQGRGAPGMGRPGRTQSLSATARAGGRRPWIRMPLQAQGWDGNLGVAQYPRGSWAGWTCHSLRRICRGYHGSEGAGRRLCVPARPAFCRRLTSPGSDSTKATGIRAPRLRTREFARCSACLRKRQRTRGNGGWRTFIRKISPACFRRAGTSRREVATRSKWSTGMRIRRAARLTRRRMPADSRALVLQGSCWNPVAPQFCPVIVCKFAWSRWAMW